MKYLSKNDNFNDLISNGIHLVDFYADWCGPCKMMEPILNELDIDVIKVNVDEFKDLASEYRVMSIPDMIIFKDGKKKKEVIGFTLKEDLIDLINKED